MRKLEQAGISMKAVTDQLVDEGVKSFADSFRQLISAVDGRLKSGGGAEVNRISLHLPAELDSDVKRTLADWDQGRKMQRLWDRDASLWTGQDEAKWLGWLDIVDAKAPVSPELEALPPSRSRRTGSATSLLLGMGGSSLCPEVLARTYGPVKGKPELAGARLHRPGRRSRPSAGASIRRRRCSSSPARAGARSSRTSSSSSSGRRRVEAVGQEKAGRHFVAITDPGSKMEQVAKEHRFRHIFPGRPSIGGRYSALSNFGLVPAGAMGLDVPRFLGQHADHGAGLRGRASSPRRIRAASSARCWGRWRKAGATR